MTINHIFLNVTPSVLPRLRKFYCTILQPLGYVEMIKIPDRMFGFGSDYPYLWLQAEPLLESQKPIPVHLAIDAPDFAAVDKFYALALENGAKDNGKPGIRPEMGRQPYYAAFVIDEEGNNIEAVCVQK